VVRENCLQRGGEVEGDEDGGDGGDSDSDDEIGSNGSIHVETKTSSSHVSDISI